MKNTNKKIREEMRKAMIKVAEAIDKEFADKLDEMARIIDDIDTASDMFKPLSSKKNVKTYLEYVQGKISEAQNIYPSYWENDDVDEDDVKIKNKKSKKKCSKCGMKMKKTFTMIDGKKTFRGLLCPNFHMFKNKDGVESVPEEVITEEEA